MMDLFLTFFIAMVISIIIIAAIIKDGDEHE